MTVFYTNERARYGGVSGTIVPFPIKLPDINVPDQGHWREYLPAGYLRCDGSVYQAEVFPELAEVLGVGVSCRYKKPDTELLDNQFQVPDLGAKSIRTSKCLPTKKPQT